jgi:adenylate cyclase
MSALRKSALQAARKLWGGIATAVVIVVLVWAGQLEWLEALSLDLLFELRGARAPHAPIVIVTVDDSSFAELSNKFDENVQWPFPREMHARLLDRISAGGPLAIGVDIVFDSLSALGPKDDAALGAAVARAGNVVLGAAPSVDVQTAYAAKLGYERIDMNAPIAEIRGKATYAPVNVLRDADGHVRRAVKTWAIADTTLPSFAVAIYDVARAAGLAVAPMPRTPHFLINFRGGPRVFTWLAYYQVLRGEIEPQMFQGKIVLVGPTADLFHDVFGTPFARSGTMPGVVVHANVIDTLVRGDAVREVPEWVSTILAVVAAFVGAALVVRLRAFRALGLAVGLWVVLTLAAFAAFSLTDVWMRGMAGTLALVLGFGSTVVEHFVREQREKKRLSRFFSSDVLRAVVRDRDERKSLGASRRLVTVLFSDLRGFTSISEKLPPEQIDEMLREYLTEMTKIVFKNGGTVDKYIGDCVMALYNVPFEDPEHAIRAVRTGLEFQERTLAAAERWEAKYGVSIRNGVGINTGEAIVGTLGSQQILQYTAIGDTVNLAARLESITKDYHASIIISESTYEYVKDKFPTRGLGEVTVKGKSVPVKIFAVLPPDIRKYPRAVLDAGAALTNAATGQICQVRTRDISEGGLALAGVPADWTIGSKVEIKIDGGDLLKPIIAEGTIAWRRGDDAGINFTQIESDSVTEYVAGRGRKGG